MGAIVIFAIGMGIFFLASVLHAVATRWMTCPYCRGPLPAVPTRFCPHCHEQLDFSDLDGPRF